MSGWGRTARAALVVSVAAVLAGALPVPTARAQACEVVRVHGADEAGMAAAVSAQVRASASEVLIARRDDYADALAAIPLATQRNAPLLLTDRASLSGAARAEIRRLGAARATILGGTGAVSRSVEDALVAEGLRVERVAGSSRWATAGAVADRLRGPITEVIVVEGASADPARGWPDAVAAGPLAAALGAPILLVLAGEIPQPTRELLARLAPARITVVGGTAAVSHDVLRALADPDGDGRWERPVRRLAGASRHLTSVESAWQRIRSLGEPPTLWLASGSAFPEALVAASAAAATGGVMALVDGASGLAGQPAAVLRRDLAAPLRTVALVGGAERIGAAAERDARAWMCSGDVPTPDLGRDALECAAGGLADHVRVRGSRALADAADAADANRTSAQHGLALMRAAGPFTAHFDRQPELREQFAGWVDRGAGYGAAYHETAHHWQFAGSPTPFERTSCLALDSQQRGVLGADLDASAPPPHTIGEQLRARAAALFARDSFQMRAIDTAIDIYLSADSQASSHESTAALLGEFHAYVLGYELDAAVADSRGGSGPRSAGMDGGWAIVPGTALYLRHLRTTAPAAYAQMVARNGVALAELHRLWERSYPGPRAGFSVDDHRALWDYAFGDGLATEVAMATSGRAGTGHPTRP